MNRWWITRKISLWGRVKSFGVMAVHTCGAAGITWSMWGADPGSLWSFPCRSRGWDCVRFICFCVSVSSDIEKPIKELACARNSYLYPLVYKYHRWVYENQVMLRWMKETPECRAGTLYITGTGGFWVITSFPLHRPQPLVQISTTLYPRLNLKASLKQTQKSVRDH